MARKGRPTKAAKPGTRASLGLKVTAELKSQLEEAAERSGRTQSQEAEYRLERSFGHFDLLREILEIGYGRHLAALTLAMADTAARTAAGTNAIRMTTGDRKAPNFNQVLSDPWTRLEVVKAVTLFLERLTELAPQGDARAPEDARKYLTTNRFGHGIGGKAAKDIVDLLLRPGEDRMRWAGDNLADILPEREVD